MNTSARAGERSGPNAPRWIWHDGDPWSSHQLALFRRAFTARPGSGSKPAAVLRIAANVWYEAWLNGRRIGRGHTLSSLTYKYVDRYVVGGHLRRGRNVLAVMVYCTGHHRPAMLMQERGPGGLWLELTWREGARTRRMVSDGAWRATAAPGWRPSPGPATLHRGNFKEHIDQRRWPTGWTDLAYRDTRWSPARPYDPGAAGLWARLVRREVPHLEEADVAPVNAFTISAGTAYGFGAANGWEIPEPQAVVGPDAATAAWACLAHGENRPPPAPITATRILPGRDGMRPSLLVDFGRLLYGRPEVVFDAVGRGRLEVGYGESLNLTYLDRFDFGPGPCGPGPVQDRFFRHLLLTWDIRRPVELRSVRVRRRHYPVRRVGHFRCDQPLLNRMWDVGVETTHLSMYEHYVDCPYREHGLYWDDLVVQADAAHAAFGDTRLLRKCLRQGAWVQADDGRLQAPLPDCAAGIFLVDFVPHYIASLRMYHWQTGTTALLRELWPTVRRALEWHEAASDADGLLDLTGRLQRDARGRSDWWCYLDWSRVDKRGVVTGLNALYHAALRDAAAMASALGDAREARRLTARAARLRTAIVKRAWSARAGAFVDCVVGGRPGRSSAEVTSALAAWTGVADKARAARLAGRLDGSAEHLATGGPMLTRITEVLFRQGRDDAAFARMDGYWGEMVRRGADAYWEIFDARSPARLWPHKLWSTCHGWGGGIVSLLHRYVLGVQATEPGGGALRIDPHPGPLREAEGTVPGAAGPVHVRWRRTGRGGRLRIEVKAPRGVTWTTRRR